MIHKGRCEFRTETMLNTNEPETHLPYKPRYKVATQTMLNTYEPETHLSHKPRYKLAKETMLIIDKPETHLLLKYVKVTGFINHVVNLAQEPC